MLIEAGVSSTFGNWQTRGASPASRRCDFSIPSRIPASCIAPTSPREPFELAGADANHDLVRHWRSCRSKSGFNINRGRRIDTMELGQQMR